MFESIEMDEVGTQGAGGREGQGNKPANQPRRDDRNANQPRRDDRQSENQRSNREEQGGRQNRPGQEEEEN
jgi:hypothetical protein